MNVISFQHAPEGRRDALVGRRFFGALMSARIFQPQHRLERKEAAHFLLLSAKQAAVHHSSNLSTHMNTTITRTIRAETEDGQLIDIPASAWADVVKVANEEFGAFVNIHVHPEVGAYHDGPLIPFPHFLIEATLEESQTGAFIERIDPIINELVASHTQLLSLATK
jgi:hypothetical protein